MRATPRILAIGLLAAAAGLPHAAAAQGRAMPTYEPQQRLRTALDTCTKSEVMRNAYCVKKCATGFRMDLAGPKPRCVGLKADATYTPPKPSYQPPAPDPSRKPPPGA
jgi:hypothetical protein